MDNKKHCCLAATAIFLLLSAETVRAASNDEIQVYDDSINKPGQWGLDLHTNYVVAGQTVPSWVGDAPSSHSLRLTPEFSYGLTDTWEVGAYMAPFLRTQEGTNYVEGAKVRVKYISAPEGSAFYWGLNNEIGRVSLRSAQQNWNLEIRPILGYRSEKWHFTVNPILEWPLSGPRNGDIDFAPAMRLSYEIHETLTFGIEHYAGLGYLSHISPYAQQTQNTYLVMDTEVAGHAIDLGIGKGWNADSDRWTIKGIFSSRF